MADSYPLVNLAKDTDSEAPTYDLLPTDNSDFFQMDLGSLDFSGTTMPEVTTIDYAKLIEDTSAAATLSTNTAISNALGLANAQGDTNAAAIQRATDLSLTQTRTVYKSLTEAAQESQFALLDASSPGWREMISSASGAVQETVDAIGGYLSANLPTMLKNGADMAKQRDKIVTSLMNGEIPDDLNAQVQRQAEEKAGAYGIFGNAEGSAKQNLVARDLGMTKLNLQLTGAEMAKDSAALWSSAALNAAAMASSAVAPIAAFAELQTKFGLAPTVDINKIYADTYDTNVKATTVNPDNVFSGAMAQYNAAMGWGIDVAKTNQDAQSSYDSMSLQFETDKMNASVALRGAEIAANTTLWASQLEARTTENAARIEANSMMEVAYKNAETFIETANIGAKSAVKQTEIENEKYSSDYIHGTGKYASKSASVGASW